MGQAFWRFNWLCIILLCGMPLATSASDWHAIALPSRPMNIVENDGVLWVCGADELIADSTDGGKDWTVSHAAKDSGVLLDVGFANSQVGYATGTTGSLLLTNDSGKTWKRIKAPEQVLYTASFSDEQHGIVHAPRAIYTTSDGGATWVPVKMDLQSEELSGFPYVSAIVALDPQHMIIVVSEGEDSANHQKLLVTKDAGVSWKVIDIPSTGLADLSKHGGEYWFAGFEVIEKDKPGGGYGVPLLMHSPDGENWTHVARWSPKEFDVCNVQGCLYWDGAGVQFPVESPVNYWTFPAEKVITAKWATAKDSICSIAAVLSCAPVSVTHNMPAYVESSSSIPTRVFPPPLNAPPAQGLQCIFCESERFIVTPDFQGVATADLRLHIGLDGLVEQTEVLQATNAAVGERLAAMARNWIFVPFVSEGVVHPVTTNVTLRAMAVKSQ
jgi:photosystem II stability/assembly factor-like uncharacterized protein